MAQSNNSLVNSTNVNHQQQHQHQQINNHQATSNNSGLKQQPSSSSPSKDSKNQYHNQLTNSNNVHSTLQSLPDMAHVSLAQQRHQMDQEFAAAATGSATPVAILNTQNSQQQQQQQATTNLNISNSSLGKLPQQPQQQHSVTINTQKRSALHHVDEQPNATASKFRLQSLINTANGNVGNVASVGNAAVYNSSHQTGAPVRVGDSTANNSSANNGGASAFSSQMAETQQVQYSRSLKGTGNQIAAMVGGASPFLQQTVGGQQSTLSQLTQQQLASSAGQTTQQQMVNFRDLMAARTTITALDSNTGVGAQQYKTNLTSVVNTNESEEQLQMKQSKNKNMSGSSSHLTTNNHHNHQQHNAGASSYKQHLPTMAVAGSAVGGIVGASSTIRSAQQTMQQQSQSTTGQHQHLQTNSAAAATTSTATKDIILSSAGRKTRIKSSGRKRRFSTNSIHNNTNNHRSNERGGRDRDRDRDERKKDDEGYDSGFQQQLQQLESNRGGKNSYLGNSSKFTAGPLQMGQQAATQIIQNNSNNQKQFYLQQQRTQAAAAAANHHQQKISSVVNTTAYSSVGELKIQNQGTHGMRSGATAYYQTNATQSSANEPPSAIAMAANSTSAEVTGVMDRFNSRAQKKALNSVQTVSASNKEQLLQYNSNLVQQQIVDIGSNKLMKGPHQHYGTHQSYNSTTSATNVHVHKQGSHSVTRRNNQHQALQETNASGHCLESGGSQHSHRSNHQHHAVTGVGVGGSDQQAAAKENAKSNHINNYNSLRNSKSLNKKLSQTGAKKQQKKLKKSESQARHQQITKSEMMTQQMRDQEHDIDLTSQERQKNSFPSGLNSMNGTSSAMNRAPQSYHQQEPHVKRVSNRTPQSFTVNNDKVVISGLPSTVNKGMGAASSSNKYNDVIKGSTTANNALGGAAQAGGSNQANAGGGSNINKNITDLHKNAMHIKKLNFGGPNSGGRQMQSHATQPVIPPQQQSHQSNHPSQNASHHYSAGGAPHTSTSQPPQSNNSYQSTLHHHNHHPSSSAQKTSSHHYKSSNTDRAQYFSAPNQAATSTIESLLRNAAVATSSAGNGANPGAQTGGNSSFQDFKNAFSSSSGQKQQVFGNGGGVSTTSAASNQVTQKTYKMMKSAERSTGGASDTNNMLIQQMSCRLHQENPNAIASASSASPCTCSASKPSAHQQRLLQQNSGGGFQSKASQNFQKSFRHGNFVYHGGSHRRSNDFNTIQTKQTTTSSNTAAAAGGGASPFSANIAQTPSFNQNNQPSGLSGSGQPHQPPPQQTPHITQQKREDVNKFGGNFGSSQLSNTNNQSHSHHLGGNSSSQQQNSQNSSSTAAQSNPASNLNPLMRDLLHYLQQAYQSQNQTEQSTSMHTQQQTQSQQQNVPLQQNTHLHQNAVDQLKQRLAQAQMRQAAHQQTQSNQHAAAAQSDQQSAPSSSFSQQLASSAQKNKLIHFEKGDRIIYEPNEMHQLKYINDKGEVSPITGVQYILTQPNFSKGRPCHFFVVNKQEFEAATKGFKLKQEEQKAEELAKQRKMQAVANIRSHRASQKIRTHNTATGAGGKGKKGGAIERKQSAKGGRGEANTGTGKDGANKTKEEEKKDDKDKYHNQAYNYQKLKSLKWMGGPYRNPHDDPAPIWRPSAEEQELRQQLEAKREIKAKYNLLSLNKQAGIELYKYILMLGNNQEVVKRVMDSRPSWTQIKSTQTLYNFKWAPSSRQIKFDFLGKHGQKNLVNHFENHALITTKDQLIESMSKLCENLHQDVFNSIPITFVIDLGTPLCQHEFDKFTYYYNMVEKFKDQYLDAEDDSAKEEVLGQMNKSIQQHYQLSEKKRKSTTVTMRSTLYNGHNMWLFKPADANRGRGVNLFNTIDQLKRLILEHTSRAETKQFQNFAHANNLHGTAAAGGNQSAFDNQDPAAASNSAYANSNQAAQNHNANNYANNNATEQLQPANTQNIKSDVFVLQKYIERPLLISQRKFDIRLWVMITPEHKCYYFKEGYIRMSGQKYDLNKADNLFVHLTNNAIQKHGQNYGEFEEGNILSFNEGAEYLRKQDNINVDFYQLLKDEMLPIIEMTMMSVRQKINKNNRKFCMEIFGYDFMVDHMLRPWLIEVNTNPCLEESNQLLRKLIPRMLDDAFKLTLDVMFPPKTAAQIAEAREIMQEDQESPSAINGNGGKPETFSVPGRPDNENLWGDQPFYILRVPGAVVVQGS